MLTKRFVLAVFVVTGLALGSLPAVAGPVMGMGIVHDYGNYVDLGTDIQKIVLTGTGSSTKLNIDLGSCSGGTCTLSGVAKGYGTFAPPASALYTISSPANLTLKEINATTGLWEVASNANTIKFNYGTGGSLLTGYLNDLEFSQIPSVVSNGHDEYLGTANVTITGGSLDKTSGMEVQFLVTNSPKYFQSLTGSGNTGSSIAISYGEGPLYPTPEPATLALLGAGFLLVGGVVRTRFRHQLWRS
jgi:hypothetical protein